jgi:hypothetical protein
MERAHFNRLVDNVQGSFLTAPLEPHQPARELAKTVADSNTRKLGRFQAGVHLLARPFEAVGLQPLTALSNRYIRTENLPFTSGETPLIGRGCENFVFKLPSEKPMVLKVDKNSLTMTTEEKIEHAKQLQAAHEQTRKWFEDVEGFVEPSQVIVGQLPFKNAPAVGIVQPYEKGIQGIFEDFQGDELINFLAQNDTLRRDFLAITGTVLSTIETEERTIDFCGDRNIALVTTNGTPHFVLLDSSSIQNIPECKERFGEQFIQLFDIRKGQMQDWMIQAQAIEVTKQEQYI